MTQSPYAIDSSTPLKSGADAITLIQDGAFLVCSHDLSITPGGMQGFYFADTRLISTLELLVNGQRVFGLEHRNDDASASEIGIVGDPSRPAMLVEQEYLLLPNQLELHVRIMNLESVESEILLDLSVASDFADIFDVKRGEAARGGFVGSGPSNGSLVLAYENREFRRGVRISVDEDHEVLRDGIRVSKKLAQRTNAVLTFRFSPEIQRYRDAVAKERPERSVTFDYRSLGFFERTSIQETACRDLESLLILDSLTAKWVIAAGSPWFLTLFGRDSLITSIQTMPLNVSLGLNVLHGLAVRQGQKEDAETGEQPGRILHEVRTGEAVERPGGWGDVYFGSVDATPLFIVALGESLRRGASPDVVRQLMPAAEMAYQWIDGAADLSGDGFIEYPGRATHGGLDNQSWKDSIDSMRHRDGKVAEGPLAVVEVQGYKHAALLSLAYLRQMLAYGEPEGLLAEAAILRKRIHEMFWMEDEDCFALALDRDRKHVGSVSSNAGHLLWTGTVFDEYAPRLARRLMQPDMFTGFGLRTLSSNNPGWNPLSYHCGTVWPHDSALTAAGMHQYGLTDDASRLSNALFDAADCCSGRLPELFGGFDRADFPEPVPYPSSCSPQAWAAGASLMLAQFMRFDAAHFRNLGVD